LLSKAGDYATFKFQPYLLRYPRSVRDRLSCGRVKETQGFAPNYPMIADTDYNVSKLYGMLPAPVSGDPTKRTAADNQTVRNVFVIGPARRSS
jgi:hypothetical protein